MLTKLNNWILAKPAWYQILLYTLLVMASLTLVQLASDLIAR